jgi:hypothetical protein
VGGLFVDGLQDGGRAEVELVEQEVVGVDCLQPERAERRGGEVGQVGDDDGVRAPRTAAATTCRSSGSGSRIPGWSSSQPVTIASLKVSRMREKRLLTPPGSQRVSLTMT